MRKGEISSLKNVIARSEATKQSHKSIYEIATSAFGGLAMTSLLCLSLLIVGCTKEKRDNPISTSTGGSTGASNLASLQSDIFALGCATSGCHDNRANPAGSLNMSSSAQSYANLVNRNSTQVASLKIVLPNNPGSSYLVNKLQNTHLLVGGSGTKMPFGWTMPQEDLDRILDWISNGAQNN